MQEAVGGDLGGGEVGDTLEKLLDNLRARAGAPVEQREEQRTSVAAQVIHGIVRGEAVGGVNAIF